MREPHDPCLWLLEFPVIYPYVGFLVCLLSSDYLVGLLSFCCAESLSDLFFFGAIAHLTIQSCITLRLWNKGQIRSIIASGCRMITGPEIVI